jgi:hypothetical protein
VTPVASTTAVTTGLSACPSLTRYRVLRSGSRPGNANEPSAALTVCATSLNCR